MASDQNPDGRNFTPRRTEAAHENAVLLYEQRKNG
jgi:hypothetical protein